MIVPECGSSAGQRNLAVNREYTGLSKTLDSVRIESGCQNKNKTRAFEGEKSPRPVAETFVALADTLTPAILQQLVFSSPLQL